MTLTECKVLLQFEKLQVPSNIYYYSDGINMVKVIDLIGNGVYLSITKPNTDKDTLVSILKSFNIAFDEKKCDDNLESITINKIRRYL